MKNLFAQAKVIEAKPVGTKKDDKKQVVIPGLRDYAVIDSLVKNLTTIKETLHVTVEAEMRKVFVDSKTRPENFRGIEGEASASCELKRRATSSPLNDEEVAKLEKHDIPYDVVPVTEERFVINPAYMSDQKLLEQISAALSKVKGLPEDFIMLQKGSSKRVVSDEGIDKVFELGLAEILLEDVCVMSVKAKLEEVDIATSVGRAQDLLGIAKSEKLAAKKAVSK